VRHFHDKSLGGHALIFDGPKELVEAARDANRGRNPFKKMGGFRWPGRNCPVGDWARAAQYLSEPWPEAVAKIKYVVDFIRKMPDLPQPRSVKRKARWSDCEGEVGIDRALKGEPECYRDIRRNPSHAPMNVALLSNLESTKHWYITNPSGLFYRSMAAIAVADVLEECGYSVEVWIWSRGLGVYPKPDDEQFLACKVKHAGDLVDYDAMADAMSDWFTTQAIFGVLAANPEVKPVSKGNGVEAALNGFDGFFLDDGTPDWYNYGIDYWVKYLDITEDTQAIPIPLVVGASAQSAADAAAQVLQRIVEKQ
jgi:hypothetical protein